LDYTGDGLNTGSKVVFAAVGSKRRVLTTELPGGFELPRPFHLCKLALPGVLAVEAPAFTDEATENNRIETWCHEASNLDFAGIQLLVLCDDAAFTAANVDNFVWITFTRSNPSHDIHGVNSFIRHKHWGCHGPLVIDARKKPHHAPELIKDAETEKRIDALGVQGGPLHGII